MRRIAILAYATMSITIDKIKVQTVKKKDTVKPNSACIYTHVCWVLLGNPLNQIWIYIWISFRTKLMMSHFRWIALEKLLLTLSHRIPSDCEMDWPMVSENQVKNQAVASIASWMNRSSLIKQITSCSWWSSNNQTIFKKNFKQIHLNITIKIFKQIISSQTDPSPLSLVEFPPKGRSAALAAPWQSWPGPCCHTSQPMAKHVSSGANKPR